MWFHVCSFGEARAIDTVSSKLDKNLLRFTATTQTGYKVISSYTKQSRYLPFEPWLYIWTNRHKALVVFEAELWYLLFRIARAKGAKTFLINARISPRSYPKYKRFAFLYRKIFSEIDSIYAQSQEDKARLESLGAKNVKICGNLKFASIPKKNKDYPKPKGIVVCAGSTHEGEEKPIIEAFLEMKKRYKSAKLIIVPRHPERFESVYQLSKRYTNSSSKFSQSRDFESDITVVDKMGELINCYAISDIAILGGAFEPIGGHNALEIAQFNIPIISGEHYFNQKELFRGIDGIVISRVEDLKGHLLNYERLPKSKIVAEATGVEDIIKEIESVLYDR